jgi:hypothetical protein
MSLIDFLYGIRVFFNRRSILKDTIFCCWIDPDDLISKMEYQESENISTFTTNNHNQNSSANIEGIIKKYVVEKLIANNYRMWKTRMELIMERNNLKEIVDGSTKMLDDEPYKGIWKSMDLDARMEIIIHLSDKQVDYVQNLKTT